MNTLQVFHIYNKNNLHNFSIFYNISIFSFLSLCVSKCVAWKIFHIYFQVCILFMHPCVAHRVLRKVWSNSADGWWILEQITKVCGPEQRMALKSLVWNSYRVPWHYFTGFVRVMDCVSAVCRDGHSEQWDVLHWPSNKWYTRLCRVRGWLTAVLVLVMQENWQECSHFVINWRHHQLPDFHWNCPDMDTNVPDHNLIYKIMIATIFWRKK